MMRALRIKTFKKKRHNKEPRSIPADRSSNFGSLPVADEGSEVAEQDEHSLKRPTMPKRPPGVFWSTHKAVQDCRDKHDEILQALEAFGKPGKPTTVQERICRNHLLTHVDDCTESVNTSGGVGWVVASKAFAFSFSSTKSGERWCLQLTAVPVTPLCHPAFAALRRCT